MLALVAGGWPLTGAGTLRCGGWWALGTLSAPPIRSHFSLCTMPAQSRSRSGAEDRVTGIVDGRGCKGCTLCCKLLAISELEKPCATWCTHCDMKRGCKVHGSHPQECRDFYCGYLTNSALDERWNPAKCRIVLTYDKQHAARLSVHVDPGRAGVWREEPFYSQIKRWAVAAAAVRGQVIVWRGLRAIAVLPDREKDLGEVTASQFILTSQKMGAQGSALDVVVVDHDDPKAQALQTKRR